MCEIYIFWNKRSCIIILVYTNNWRKSVNTRRIHNRQIGRVVERSPTLVVCSWKVDVSSEDFWTEFVENDFDGWLNYSGTFTIGVSIQRGKVQPVGCPGANDPRGERLVFSGIGGAEQEIRLVNGPLCALLHQDIIPQINVREIITPWQESL